MRYIMINFNGLRGSGKTVKLVKTAYLDYKLAYRPVIVTIQKDMEEIYRNAGLPNEIPVITYKKYGKSGDCRIGWKRLFVGIIVGGN